MDEVNISKLSLHHRGTESDFTEDSLDAVYAFVSDRDTVSYIRQCKVMFLMRGPPGSGKSTIVQRLRHCYPDIVVCSADHYFITDDGQYRWDRSKLSEAHHVCLQKAEEAAVRGKNLVIDNTNIQRWEMLRYYKIADHSGYIVIVVVPRTPWVADHGQLALKNRHDLSLTVCQQKVEAFLEVNPFYWAWFLNQSDSAKLLDLACKYFIVCVRTIADFRQQLRKCFSLAGLCRSCFKCCF